MTKYVVNQNQEIKAASLEALVDEMNASAFEPAPTRIDFMVRTADRVADQIGKPVRADTVEHFVEDLMGAGLIKELA